MKRLIYYIFSVTLLLMVGCDNNSLVDEYDFSASSGLTVSFSATISSDINYEWYEGDAVGLFAADYVSTKNLMFRVDDTESNTLEYQTQQIYLGSVESVSYSAYFPYSELIEGSSYTFDMTALADFDYIEATTDDSVDEDGNYVAAEVLGSDISISEIGLLWGKLVSSEQSVSLTLDQKFARVSVESVAMADGSTLPSNLSCTLCNVYQTSSFNFESGEFSSSVVGNLPIADISEGAFVVPQTDLSAVEFLFTDGSNLYTAKPTSDVVSWVSGEEYSYSLQLTEYTTVSSVTLSTDNKYGGDIIEGESITIESAIVGGEYLSIEWLSSNKAITVEASADGESATVTGSTVGASATITMNIYVLGESEPISATFDVAIISSPVEATQVMLSVNGATEGDAYGDDLSITIGVGESFSLAALVLPEEATYKGYTWSTVGDYVTFTGAEDTAGEVTGSAEGSATITATSTDMVNDGVKPTGKITVTVKDYVTAATITGATSVVANGSTDLTLNLTGSNYTSIVWTLTGSGAEITAGQGTTTLTVKGLTTDTSVTLSATVSLADGRADVVTDNYSLSIVGAAVPVTGIEISSAQSISVGDDLTLTPTFTPASATDLSYTWTITDADGCATVVTNTASQPLKLTGAKEGSLSVTVTAGDTTNGTFTSTCAVTVLPVYATSVTLSATSQIVKVGDDSFSLTAALSPSNVTYDGYTWTTSGDTSAISANALNSQPLTITPSAEGVVTVTATSEDGQKSASCTIIVQKATPETSDYYYANQTYSSASMLTSFKLNNTNSVVGVVYNVGDTTAKVVHINTPSAVYAWVDGSNTYADAQLTTAVNTTCGIANMKAVKDVDSTFSDFPLFSYVDGLNSDSPAYDDTTATDLWYVPVDAEIKILTTWLYDYYLDNSLADLKTLFNNGGRVLVAKDFTVDTGNAATGTRYWTSIDSSSATNTNVYVVGNKNSGWAMTNQLKDNATIATASPIMSISF